MVDKALYAPFSAMSIAVVRRYPLRAQGPSSIVPRRTLHASAILRARTRAATDNDHSFDLDDVDEDDERHTTSFGWEIIRQQKQFHDYMRAIERDAPVLQSRLFFLTHVQTNNQSNTFQNCDKSSFLQQTIRRSSFARLIMAVKKCPYSASAFWLLLFQNCH